MQHVRIRLVGLTVVMVAVCSSLLLAPMSVEAQTNLLTVGFSTTFTHISGATGQVSGAFTLEQFTVRDGQLVAVGHLSFSLCVLGVDPKNCLATVDQQITLLVTSIAGTCEQLQVALGSLDVTDPSLPGYTVHLPTLVIDITAQSDTPKLLERLLCAIAHRLDSNAPLHSLAPLLNRLLELLQ